MHPVFDKYMERSDTIYKRRAPQNVGVCFKICFSKTAFKAYGASRLFSRLLMVRNLQYLQYQFDNITYCLQKYQK